MVFDEALVQAVWEKGRISGERDQTTWRQDQCGAWMRRDHYGNPESEFGWKILSLELEDSTDIESMHPFHEQNDYDIPAARPRCVITSDRTQLRPWQTTDQPRNMTI
jgi:hypothetical protein